MKNIAIEEFFNQLYNKKITCKEKLEFKNEFEELNIGQMTNYYALRYFFKYSHKRAYELVSKSSYEKINKITNVQTSLEQLVESFKKYFLNDFPSDNLMDVIVGNAVVDKDYSINMSNYIYKSNNKSLFNIYLKVFCIANDIHDKWVMENAYKYNRDINLLFQHLPLALIGEKELRKDLIFIEPLFNKLGISLINISYRKYYISNTIYSIYCNYLEFYLNKYSFNIKNWDKIFAKMIREYEPLKVSNAKSDQKEYARDRKEFMNERSTREVLTKSLMENNGQLSLIMNFAKYAEKQ